MLHGGVAPMTVSPLRGFFYHKSGMVAAAILKKSSAIAEMGEPQ